MLYNNLIAWEGLDASGKATQSALMAAALGGVVIPFPQYQTAVGQDIRAHLEGRWYCAGQLGEVSEADRRVLQCLMAINRYESIPVIQHALERGGPVILDRYWGSGFIYGKADGLPKDWLLTIHALLPQPRVWFFLDVPVEVSVARRKARAIQRGEKGVDYYDREDKLLLMQKLRETGLLFFTEQAARVKEQGIPQHWIILDGTQNQETIAATALSVLVGGII